MKVKVLKNFIDKETREFMAEGTEQEYETRRAMELKEKGFVEMLEEKIKKEPIIKEVRKTTKKRKSIAND